MYIYHSDEMATKGSDLSKYQSTTCSLLDLSSLAISTSVIVPTPYTGLVIVTGIEEVEGNALVLPNAAMLATIQEMILSTIGDLLQQQTGVEACATMNLMSDNIPEHRSLDENYPSPKRTCIVLSYRMRSKTPAPSQAKGKAKAKTATKSKKMSSMT
jgi:hypothetical protein